MTRDDMNRWEAEIDSWRQRYEALLKMLADNQYLAPPIKLADKQSYELCLWHESAAELRRLHAENEALRRERDANLDTINVDNAIITRLRAQRDALLEALKIAVRQNEHDMVMTGEELRQAYATIAKATGGDARCPLCRYEHGHAIGCDNNPVDKALAASAKAEENKYE